MPLRLQVKTLWTAIKQPTILYPAVFVFLWQATPSADSALFYFYNDALGFGPEFLGRVRLAGSVASLVGIWLYNSYLKSVPLRTMFKWSAITGTALSLTQVCRLRSLQAARLLRPLQAARLLRHACGAYTHLTTAG